MAGNDDPLERAAEEAEREGSIREEHGVTPRAGQGAEVEDARIADDTRDQTRPPGDGGREA
jgi:hypothetical protein